MRATGWKLETDYHFNVTPLWLMLQKIYSCLLFPVLYLDPFPVCEVWCLPRGCLHLQGYPMACVTPQLSLVEVRWSYGPTHYGPQAFCAHLVSALLLLNQGQGIYVKKTLWGDR